MGMKFYCIFGGVILGVSLLTTSFAYVIKRESQIKALQNQNLIFQVNEKQYQIELKNNAAVIQALQKQIQKQKKLSQERERLFNQAKNEIQSLSIQEKIKIINSVFNN